MRTRWTPAAAADLQGISDYLKERHPRYRDPTMRRLYGDIRALKKWPGRGRPGREEGPVRFYFRPLPMWRCIASRSRPSKSCAFITPRKTGIKRASEIEPL
jgi:plasmid stabilization system protein ParE